MSNNTLTDLFTLLEPQDQLIGDFFAVRKLLSKEIEALKF